MSRWLYVSNLVAIALIIFYGVAEYGAPRLAVLIWKDDYKSLMFKCDQVMRDHYLAKQAVSVSPNNKNIANLDAAEIGLIDCHYYDKLRKQMLLWGVSEIRLSMLGLEAVESKAYELRRFVEIHEIRY